MNVWKLLFKQEKGKGKMSVLSIYRFGLKKETIFGKKNSPIIFIGNLEKDSL